MNDELDFTLDHNGATLNIHVDVNYPFYAVSINGENKAQLEQDQHSNWFKTTGTLEDELLQLIGKRIAFEITGQ